MRWDVTRILENGDFEVLRDRSARMAATYTSELLEIERNREEKTTSQNVNGGQTKPNTITANNHIIKKV